jgi:hypothetical protein
MATKKVTVTRELIDRATTRDSHHCMIAEAIKEATPLLKNISVDLQTIRYTDPRTKTRYTCLTPPAAAHALVEFDQGRAVEPFVLSLQPVHKVAALTTAGKRDRHGDLIRSRTRTRRQKPVVKESGSRSLVVEGGPSLPHGHLGGTASGSSESRAETTTTPEGNILVSGGRYRRYGLRQLRA